MFFTYILRCADDTLYAGSTSDLDRRVIEHNESKRGARYTKARRPVTLAYHETFPTLGAALRREAELKKLTRAQKLALFS